MKINRRLTIDEQLTEEESYLISQTKFTLKSDPFFKTFFKDIKVLILFLLVMFHLKVTPDMISYEDTENIGDGGLTIRHDLFVTVHLPDEDKIIHINLEMQNKYYKGLSQRMEDDLHLGKFLKLKNRDQSKKITYYGLWFLSEECSKHYSFKDYIKECTIKDQYNEPLANNDFIYIINLQKMLNCSIIELQELAKLFINIDNNKSEFVTKAGKVWYDKMEDMNKDDILKRHAYNMILDERDHKEEIEDAEAKGIVIGKAEGEIIGQNKKAIEVAKKMLDKGLDNETISECTGLSIEEVNELNID